MPKMSYCQDTDFAQVRSSITGRSIIVNQSTTKFLVLPSFAPRKMASAVNRFLVYEKTLPARSVGLVRATIAKLPEAVSIKDFISAIDRVCDSIPKASVSPNMLILNRSRVIDLFGMLWLADCLAFPRLTEYLGASVNYRGRLLHRMQGDGAKVLDDFEGLLKVSADRQRSGAPYAMAHKMVHSTIVSCSGIREPGDLTPEVFDGRLTVFAGYKKYVVDNLLALLRDRYPGAAIPIAADYGFGGKPATRADDAFLWAVSQNSGMEAWRVALAEWMGGQKHNTQSKRNAINHLLSGLLAWADAPKDPVALLRTGFSGVAIAGVTHHESEERLQRNQKALHDFFEWLLSTRCIAEGDDGRPYRVPGFSNPIILTAKRRKGPSETVREALPLRYLRMLQEIIEEDDYAWPKSLRDDYFQNRDLDSGNWSEQWSPVRAYAILTKLKLPLRTFQVRVLNSGEADTERYVPSTGTWVANSHLLAGTAARPSGVLRKHRDRTSRKDFVGLYINTNKTADINAPEDQRGYVIPWQNDEVILLLDGLRTWQERYNPLTAAVPWSALHETAITANTHEDILAARGDECFLFRDAADDHRNQPVTHGRLHQFWRLLCAELEARLRALGEVGADGKPLELVSRSKGRIRSTYDLHSLRVSLLTAWAEQGVGVEVLMKIAGHCTAIMALYYQKSSIRHITEILNAAEMQKLGDEQANWERYIRSRSYEELESLISWNDTTGIVSLIDGNGASWIRKDHGICPVGESRCAEGGEKLATGYAPVPRGSRNCVQCRFFITGPPFLIGQQAHFNSLALTLRDQSRKYKKAERAFYEIDGERRTFSVRGEAFPRLAEWRLRSSEMTQAMHEVDGLALSWNAAFRLIQTSLHISRNAPLGDEQFALVYNGTDEDLDLVLELDERDESEFVLLDNVCQSAVWFRSIDPTVANFKRMRSFDAFLQRNGTDAAFVFMNESDALTAGNHLAKFMFSQFTADVVKDLICGKKTLAALGIDPRRIDFSGILRGKAATISSGLGTKRLTSSASNTGGM